MEMGARPSVGSVGDAYDNAMAESFFASLKCDFIDRRRWKSCAEARMGIFTWSRVGATRAAGTVASGRYPHQLREGTARQSKRSYAATAKLTSASGLNIY